MARSTGDLSATLMRTGDATVTARTLSISCYVFGQKLVVQAQAE